MIKAQVAHGEVERATRWILQGIEANMKMTMRNCMPVINAYLKRQDIGQALRLLHILKQYGLKMDVEVFTWLIAYYSWQGDTENALHYFHQIGAEGLKPTEYTLRALIEGFLRRGKVEEALQCADDVSDVGVAVTSGTYSIVSRWLVNNGEAEKGFKFLQLKQEQGIELGVDAYAAMMRCLLRMEEYDHVVGIFHALKSGQYVKLTSGVYLPLLEALLRLNRVEEAEAAFLTFLNSTFDRSDPIATHCFGVMFTYYSHHHMTIETIHLFKHLRDLRLPLNQKTYDILTGNRYNNVKYNLSRWRWRWITGFRDKRLWAEVGIVLLHYYMSIRHTEKVIEVYMVLRGMHVKQQTLEKSGIQTTRVFDDVTLGAMVELLIAARNAKSATDNKKRKWDAVINQVSAIRMVLKEHELIPPQKEPILQLYPPRFPKMSPPASATLDPFEAILSR
jgi:tetratricopeptide (TPR) repeat protein